MHTWHKSSQFPFTPLVLDSSDAMSSNTWEIVSAAPSMAGTDSASVGTTASIGTFYIHWVHQDLWIGHVLFKRLFLYLTNTVQSLYLLVLMSMPFFKPVFKWPVLHTCKYIHNTRFITIPCSVFVEPIVIIKRAITHRHAYYY